MQIVLCWFPQRSLQPGLKHQLLVGQFSHCLLCCIISHSCELVWQHCHRVQIILCGLPQWTLQPSLWSVRLWQALIWTSLLICAAERKEVDNELSPEIRLLKRSAAASQDCSDAVQEQSQLQGQAARDTQAARCTALCKGGSRGQGELKSEDMLAGSCRWLGLIR